jgi:hypothetical protein
MPRGFSMVPKRGVMVAVRFRRDAPRRPVFAFPAAGARESDRARRSEVRPRRLDLHRPRAARHHTTHPHRKLEKMPELSADTLAERKRWTDIFAKIMGHPTPRNLAAFFHAASNGKAAADFTPPDGGSTHTTPITG